ncbi:unnamed protein product [Eruca vesicaria subsp. sativa]|uniref:Uncharacterized protein n=1 Tax=Eruca vesicaria subsp. sativa TaxID=29727 RepID=A0ABC8J1S1_ERUVS|nr:unnamed protein product [Eruca vesicaria subsp. sativa]
MTSIQFSQVTGLVLSNATAHPYTNSDAHKARRPLFVILCATGPELMGRQVLALPDNYFDANGDIGDHYEMPTPQCMLDIVGKTHKFRVKVKDW